MFEKVLESLRNDSWDDFSACVADSSFSRMATAPKGYAGELKDICKGARDSYKKHFSDLSACVRISEKEHADDVAKLRLSDRRGDIYTCLIGEASVYARALEIPNTIATS